MKAETVYEISAFLSLDEKERLYKMLEDHIRDPKRKTKRKTPLITSEEAKRYLLEHVFNVRFDKDNKVVLIKDKLQKN